MDLKEYVKAVAFTERMKMIALKQISLAAEGDDIIAFEKMRITYTLLIMKYEEQLLMNWKDIVESL